MPKKTDPPLTQTEQSKRFRKAVHDLEVAGELSPIEADDKFNLLLARLRAPHDQSP